MVDFAFLKIFWMNISTYILATILFFAGSTYSASDFKDQYNTGPDMVYTDLRHNEPSFEGSIVGTSDCIKVKNLNMSGKVSFPKMLQESNDATSTLDFGLIKRLTVENCFFHSLKHTKPGTAELPFILVSLTFLTNKTDQFLLPQSLVISGVDTTTGIKRAWPLNKITKIIIKHSSTELAEEQQTPENPQKNIIIEDSPDSILETSVTQDESLSTETTTQETNPVAEPSTTTSKVSTAEENRRPPANSQEFKLQSLNSTLASLNNYSTQKLAWVYEQTKTLVNSATSYLAHAANGAKK